jgi:hypothetical protein
MADYYSINEGLKPVNERVYHNNTNCRAGRDIPKNERKEGTNGYPLCKDC